MIKAVFMGDPSRIGNQLQAIFPEVKNAAGNSMARLVTALSNRVKFQKLSGQVLKNQSGRLRDSISPRVADSGSVITGTVSTNKEYAAIHEYGYEGPRTYRTYLRMQKLAWGKEMKNPHEVTVHAHTVLHVKFPVRSFMRTSLAEMEPEIKVAFENAVSEVVSRMRGAA